MADSVPPPVPAVKGCYECYRFVTMSGSPSILSTTVVEILSGTTAGTVITQPSGMRAVLRFAPDASNDADFTKFFKPGTSNLPSFGQSKTCK